MADVDEDDDEEEEGVDEADAELPLKYDSDGVNGWPTNVGGGGNTEAPVWPAY